MTYGERVTWECCLVDGREECSMVVANTLGRIYTLHWIGKMTKTHLNRHINKISSRVISTE